VVRTERADALAGIMVRKQPAQTGPFRMALPDGGWVVINALDIKQHSADALTAPVS
jgi:hypothetical protein